jgi:hypothetical protein
MVNTWRERHPEIACELKLDRGSRQPGQASTHLSAGPRVTNACAPMPRAEIEIRRDGGMSS